MKSLPTGTAQSIDNFSERTRALFKDKPVWTPQASERKNRFRPKANDRVSTFEHGPEGAQSEGNEKAERDEESQS